MQYDEVLRLDRAKCIALFQGHKPALLYKLTPEELPGYEGLKPCRVIDYTPAWKQRELDAEKARESEKAIQKETAAPQARYPEPLPQAQEPDTPGPARRARTACAGGTYPDIPSYDLPDLKGTANGDIGMVPMSAVLGEDSADESGVSLN